jgi:putative aldouronate transport system permease protein
VSEAGFARPFRRKRVSGRRRLGKGASLPLYLMALPGVLAVFIFAYLPMVGIVLAFKNFNAAQGVFGSPWVGLANFDFLFRSGAAWRIIRNTVVLNFLFMVAAQVCAVIVAMLINEIYERFIAKVFQSILFFPHFISFVLVGYFTYAFLNADSGFINNILAAVGLPKVAWYSHAQYWTTILVLVSLWKGLGYFTVIYLAGMVAISPEYYEAVRMDGGSKRHEVWYVTMPFIRPLIIINVLLTIGRIFFANFELFYNTVRDTGLILQTTDVIDTYVVRSLRVLGDFNMAAAAGVFQAVCGFVLVLASNWLVRRVDPDHALF